MPAGQKGEWMFTIIHLKIQKTRCQLEGPTQCRKLINILSSSEQLHGKWKTLSFKRRDTLSLLSGITFSDNSYSDLRIYRRRIRTQGKFFCWHDSFKHALKGELPKLHAQLKESLLSWLHYKLNYHEIRLWWLHLELWGEFKSDLFIAKVPSQAFYMIRAFEKAKGLEIVESQKIFRKTRNIFFFLS